MDFNIAFFQSEHQFHLLNLNSDTIETFPIENLTNKEIHLFCLDHKFEEVPLENLIGDWIKFAPSTYKDLSCDVFELNSLISKQDFLDTLKKWTFQNNLNLIEEIYPRINFLKKLSKENHSLFIEELHYLLSTQLVASGIMIFFHDLEEIEEGQNPTLVKKIILGRKNTLLNKTNEQEAMLFNYYKSHFTEDFNLIDLEISKSALTFSSLINQSPILIMAKISDFNSLQKSMLEGLFKGLCT